VGEHALADIKSSLIHSWFQTLSLAPISKGHIRALMRKLFDLATLWEYFPADRRNPVELAKLKHVTMSAYRGAIDDTKTASSNARLPLDPRLAGAAPGVTKNLMRHGTIATTFNVYGRTINKEKRLANATVVTTLLTESTE
jgi:hypothetical protein